MKAVFFLKHYNDIDHVIPIVHEGVTSSAFDAEVVVITDKSYLRDYRLRHVASLDGARVSHVEEYDVPAITPPSPGVVKSLGRRLPTDVPKRVWRRIPSRGKPDATPALEGIESLVAEMTNGDGRTVVALDWLTANTERAKLAFAKRVSEAGRDQDVPVVALPHGDSPYVNRLFKRDLLDFDGAREQYRTGRLFDAVAVPNRHCAERYEPYLPTARVPVLGSPRYNERWLATLPELLPPDPYPADGDLNVAFFLRDRNYPIHWTELERTIRLIADIPGVRLVVKRHTRLSVACIEDVDRANVEFVGNEVHSPILLEWADAVVDLGTSIVFEAVARGTPVLEAEYLHPNRSTVAAYVEGTAMHTRDEVYHAVRRLADDTTEFYEPAERDSFVRNVIEPAGRDVLGRYVAFLSTVEPRDGR